MLNSVPRRLPALLLAALLPAGCASGEPVGPADISYGSFGARAEVDCAEGKSLEVTGSNNTLAVAGRCSWVRVTGADNRITVARVDDALSVAGLGNTVGYLAGHPAITDSGQGNTVEKR